ncbi:GAF domain-containing sensor histidine kinase [Nocardiopsis changdeensis]|uniref:GAF domain-containing protein n=1 Tax=Nocardiopsis changdeensis TaxID=2831969 RepID=A0ABX8BH14_9ACTN|nr:MULTISPECIES: GAF domain-containing protein [Nocardiopsis]QUX20643.1 GAF domain-containing protein [Nocardiopsis changdeensis]QYX36575.1 GAF domain-containing protein [Nocardiopsis sp. MT53]
MSREHLGSLLDAVVTIGGGLDLQNTLRRIVQAAMALSGARYGAIEVIGDGGRPEQFIPIGPDATEVACTEHGPGGSGLVGPVSVTGPARRVYDMSDAPRSRGFPAGHPHMSTRLRAPIRVGGKMFGNLYLTEKRGGDRFDENDESAVTALASAAGPAIENARLHEQAHHRELGLRASEEMTTRLLRGEGADKVLFRVVERACLMVDADVAAMAAPDDSGRHMAVRAASGVGAEALLERRMAVEGPPAGRAQVCAEPVITDISSDPIVSPLFGDLGIGPVLLIPLGGASPMRGLLCVGRKSGAEQFSPSAARILHTFIGHAASALESSRARADNERLVVLEDRDRIASQMHEIVIQRLSAVALSLSGVTNRVDTPLVSKRVRQAVDDIDATIHRIRSAIFALTGHETEQEHGRLCDRIMDEIGVAASRLGFTPELAMEGVLDDRIPDRIADEAVAVLREVMSNVALEAVASRVAVLVVVNGGLKVEVVDDGTGVPRVDRRAGLRHLSEHAAELGGTFDVDNVPEGGTVVTWTVPMGGKEPLPAQPPPVSG